MRPAILDAAGPGRVREVSGPGHVPWLAVPAIHDVIPGLTAGITWRGDGEPADMGLFGATPVGTVLARWRQLQADLCFATILHSRQVHGDRILTHGPTPAGLHLAPDADGHTTDCEGILLTVSVADCVPVWIFSPAARSIALLHAGWRGTAAGILESAIAQLCRQASSPPADLRIHLGPAICGACYEVGPEVYAALGLAAPAVRTRVDLREVIAGRAATVGVRTDRLTVSEWCTRCDPDRFFSHRAASSGRQIAFAGIRPDAG